MNKKVIIELTQEQQNLLVEILSYIWEREVDYRIKSHSLDADYLEELLEVYNLCLSKASNTAEAIAKVNDINDKIKDIKKIKGIL